MTRTQTYQTLRAAEQAARVRERERKAATPRATRATVRCIAHQPRPGVYAVVDYDVTADEQDFRADLRSQIGGAPLADTDPWDEDEA